MSDTETAVEANTQVSHEDAHGRVLSGVGVSADRLAETMERHAPPEPTPPAAPKGPEPGAAAPDAPVATVSRGRQRFSDLTRERDEAKAAADAARAEREQIARERDELRQRLEKPAEPAPPAGKAAEPVKAEPTRPEPTEDEIGTKYQTYAEFARDLARWVVEQERAQFDPAATVREILAQERDRADLQTAMASAQDRARKAYPDFDDVLKANGQIPMGRSVDEARARVAFIAKHPQSEHIQYAILKDAELAKRIGQSDDLAFGMAIADLAKSPAAPAAPARATWTPPPAPHPTVGASTPTTTPSYADLTKKGGHDFDSSGWREKRAAELGRKPRRW